MHATLSDLASLVGGEVIGDSHTLIEGADTLRDARPGQITFLDSTEKAHLFRAHLKRKETAAAIVIPAGFDPTPLPAITVNNVHSAFAQIVSKFRPPWRQPETGVSPHAFVSPHAELGENVNIHCGAMIGDDVWIGDHCTIYSGVRIMAGSKIGENVTIYPNAVLYEGTNVGPFVIIHACAVIGAHGFGYNMADGRHQLSAQLGNVEIGPHVEIGAGTTIDRGTYGSTVIGEGTKIDDQVMVAHNCRIGRHNLICSQVGIAGSTTTGDYVVMAGQVGVRDHVTIGDRAVLAAMAGISHDVPAGARMLGIPATPERQQKVKQALLSKLPDMRQQLKQLQQAVEELQSRANEQRPAA
ncbi:MAG: UDP-3-O-(3-hydroxymyristoyl)glucosamine N-acyltransferase [Pirellulales bacterium]|nr:UDP-3-O-(3-hydroxymyristoyl)glucosamine N-acyltransferase [Pirellulales bacterium]